MKHAIAILLVMFVGSYVFGEGQSSEHVDYEGFISLVEQGKVSALVYKNRTSLATAEVSDEGGSRSVSVNLPWHSESKPDPLLMRLLDSHGVNLTQIEEEQSHWAMVSSMILMWGVPLLNFILIVVLHFRFSKLRKTTNGEQDSAGQAR